MSLLAGYLVKRINFVLTVIFLQGRMAKLTLRTVKEKSREDKENKKSKEETTLSPTQQPQEEDLQSPDTPGNFRNLKQQKLNFTQCTKTEFSPPAAKENMTPPPAKKRRRSTAET